MGAIRLGVNETITLKLRDEFGIRTFVETGTYKGGTALWAAAHFERVATIEAYAQRWEKFIARDLPRNLLSMFGDSRVMLQSLLETIDEPVLLWLDAHWCGEGAHDSNGDECPLREELAAVFAHEARIGERDVILIDDARLFTAPPPSPHDPAQWPTFQEITALVPDRRWSIHEDVIYILPSTHITTGLVGRP